MNKTGIKFCRYGIANIATAQHLAGLCMFTLRIAALYHEFGNYPMKNKAVEKMFVGQFDKIITVHWRFIIEADDHNTGVGSDFYTGAGYYHFSSCCSGSFWRYRSFFNDCLCGGCFFYNRFFNLCINSCCKKAYQSKRN